MRSAGRSLELPAKVEPAIGPVTMWAAGSTPISPASHGHCFRLTWTISQWECHANQYRMGRLELRSAWLVLDRQHPHIPYIPVDIPDSDNASGGREGMPHKSEGIYDDP